MKPSTRRLLVGLLALGCLSGVSEGVVLAPSALSQSTSAVKLRLRRAPGQIDVVLAGLGSDVRAITRHATDSRWSARLTGVDLGDRPFTPQQLIVPSTQLLSARLEPLGSDLQLIVKARMGAQVPTPTISANGDGLIVSFAGLQAASLGSTARLDLRRPGRVAQPVAAPPLRSRAVAPPLGDMAVGTMLINNRSFVQASGPPVSLTLNNAPATDALMSLARLGGYGFVFVGDAAGGATHDYPVTMAFRDEPYDRALNSVLMSSGLQGRLDGRTLLVGTSVSAKSFGPQMSKVFRLNQVDVQSAAEYLASLGASMTAVKTVKITSGDSESSGSTQINTKASQTTTQIRETETYGSSVGPLLGLNGVTDRRLGTVTLVGDPQLISVAQSYLQQLDLRKRQVAVKVQILNIALTNDKSIDSSFSARMGDKYIVSQSGKAHINFGRFKPGGAEGTGVFDGSNPRIPGSYGESAAVEQLEAKQPYVAKAEEVTLSPETDENGRITGYTIVEKPLLVDGKRDYVPDPNPNASAQLVPVYDQYGRPKLVQKRELNNYASDSFYAYVESLVVSSSAKVLAQPTLLVQEGESARVETGENVITGVSSTETPNGSTQFENTRKNAGLALDVNVSKIDDNGFVTLSLDPEISVPVPAGIQQGVPIFNIAARSLSSGDVRLRDGQSLILTGVITESDREQVRKWPILGDMPLIGQLFRQSSSSREKNELVVIVTPAVLDDGQGGQFGYGYQPRTPAGRQLVRSQP